MWAQLLNLAIGIWLMAAPAVLDYGGAAATSDRVVGPCVAALAGVAAGECTRNVRWWLVPLALWLLVAPLALGAPAAATASTLVSGAAVLGLAGVRGRVSHRFAGGWIALFRNRTNSESETT